MLKHIISKTKLIEMISELEERIDPKNEYMEQSVREAKEDLEYLESIGLYIQEQGDE